MMSVALVLVLLAVGSYGLSRDTCSQSERPVTAVPDADAYFVALVDFRSRGTGGYGCGEPKRESMQAFEAMRWALDRLNQESGILDGNYISDTYIPGVKLGMLVEDTCSNAFTASRAVMNSYPQMFSTSRMCNQTTSLLLGAIGGSAPNVTLPVADLLNSFEVPFISYTGASKMTGHMADFMKMVPPNGFQVQVILEVLKSLRWDKVSLVHTNDEYGRVGEKRMRESAKLAGICVGTVVRLKAEETSMAVFQDTLRQLVTADVIGVVVIGGRNIASGLVQAGLTVRGAGKLQWVFSDGLGPNLDVVRNWNYARGMITVMPSSRQITEFEDHWLRISINNPPMDNPWFREWYMSTNRCRMPGVNYPPYNSYVDCQASSRPVQFSQDSNVEPAIMAVYSYAKALKEAHANLCGANFRGACRNLLQLSPVNFYQSYLQRLDFTFTRDERIPSLASIYNGGPKQIKLGTNGDLQNVAYDVWNYNDVGGSFQFQKVFRYKDGNLIYTDRTVMYDESRQQSLQSLPQSDCPSTGCGTCLATQESEMNNVYVNGDLVIGGVLSVHKNGDNPYSCGTIRLDGGAQLVQAFLYAVNRVSTLGTLRGGIKLGAMIFDDCSSQSKAENEVSNFLTGAKSYVDSSEDEIDPAKSVAFAGTTSDQISLSLAELSSQLKFSLTGFQSQSHLLASEKYPYYISMVPDDRYSIKALLALVKRVGWSYMQLVHDDSEVSQKFGMKLRMEGAMHDICFSDTTIGSTSTMSSVAEKVSKNILAKVIIVHLESEKAMELFKALNKTDGISQYAVIMMRDWLTTSMSDTFVTQLRFPVLSILPKSSNFQMFYNYLRSLTPATEDSNPWFNEWYESQLNCYIDPDVTKGYTRQCLDVQNTPVTAAQNFALHPNSIYVANAVLAIAKGIDGALRHYCGSSYTTVCNAFKMASDKADVISTNIRNASFVDDTGAIVKLNDGMGANGFEYVFAYRNNKVKAGDYATDTSQMNVDLSRLNSIRYITSHCSAGGGAGSVCPDCGYLYRHQANLISDGDVVIGGIFDIHEAGESPYSCGNIRERNGYQLSEAFMYAVNNINMGTAPVKLSGIKLGGLVLDSCSSPLRANNLVSSVYSGAMSYPVGGQVIGWTAAGDALSMEVYSLLNRTNTPFVSSTSGSYSVEDPATHFYRTVATDDSHTDALLRLIQYLGWKYIQVIYSDDSQGHNQFKVFQAKAMQKNICILSSYEIGSSMSALDAVKGMLTSTSPVAVVLASKEVTSELVNAKESLGFIARTIILLASHRWGQVILPETANFSIAVTPYSQDVKEFNNYMAMLRYDKMASHNPWFSQYYESVQECDLGTNNKYRRSCVNVGTTPVTTGNRYRQDAGVATTINAVYSMAQALNATITALCGPDSGGLCDSAKSVDLAKLVNDRLGDVNFTDVSGSTFTFTNKAHERTYDVSLFRNKQFEKVGEYSDGSLKLANMSLQTLYSDVSPTCPDGCLLCRSAQDTQEKFTYMPGDILLGGIFDVHKQGETPFSCGKVNTHQGLQLLEAFNYALQRVNSKQGIFFGRLNGVQLGGVGLDACMSPTKVGNLIANLHSGILDLKDNSGAQIPIDQIDTYVGGHGSGVSKRMAEVLSVLEIPQVSYGSTNMAFTDKEKFPYFVRTVPSDEIRAKAMVALLKRLNVEYIQIVVSDSVDIMESAKVFMHMALDKGICISQNISIPNMEEVRPTTLIDTVSLLLRKKRASVVVTFLEQDAVKQFLEAVEQVSSTEELRFLGSETWGDRGDVISSLTSSAKDALTVSLSHGENPDFKKYLEAKNPNKYTSNPWFTEYYEWIFQCSLAVGSGDFPNQCTRTTRGVTQGTNFEADPYVGHTINAVYAAAMGIDRTLRRLCGDDYNGVCEAYKRSGDRRQRIMEGIREATFQEERSQQEFKFHANGESNKGYRIFSVQQALQEQSFYYVTVGSYNDSSLLRLASSLSLSWSSTCQLATDCSECPSFGKLRSRYMATDKSNIYIIGFFDVHEAQEGDSLRCGRMDTRSGFQSALAFFFAINQINKKELSGMQLQSNVKLGGIAVDTCSNHLRVTQDTFSLLLGEGISGSHVLDPAQLLSVLATGQENTKAAADILAPRQLATINIGPGSSFPGVQSHQVSITSSMEQQSLAIASILSYLNLGYISVVYSADMQGEEAFGIFMEKINNEEATLCVAKAYAMNNPTEIVKELDNVAGSRVVVLFTDAKDTRALFETVKSMSKQDRFDWIISDRIDPVSDIPEGLQEITRGALLLRPHGRPESAVMEDFKDYLSSLTVANHGDIPDDWFDEFWQQSLRCRLENSSVPLQNFSQPCRNDARLTMDLLENNGQPAGVYQTILATYMITQAAIKLEDQECENSNGDLAACLVSRQDRGDLIYKSLLDSRLVNNIHFNFLQDGSGSLGYDINNVHFDKGIDLQSQYKLGAWNVTLKSLSLNITAFKTYDEYGTEKTSLPVSRCPTYTCFCHNRQRINGTSGAGAETGGSVIRELHSVDHNEYFRQTWGIVVAAVASVGIVCAISSFIYLAIFYPFKGGTTVLGYLLLLGVLCMYVLVFAYLVHASNTVCGIRRFCVGFVYAICFSCMIVKVLNNWRLGAYVAEYVPPSKERIAHPFSLFFITLFLILVQVIIGIMWLVLKPPVAYLSSEGLPRCSDSFSGDSDAELVVSLIYVMMLIIVTLVFSAVTWDSEENHRESCWILIATCFTIGIWIAWTVITTMTEMVYREPALAIGLVLNATLLLLCIFVRKIYLLIRYRKDEEERKSQYAASSIHEAPSKVNEVYGTLYPNHLYVDNPVMNGSHEKLSHPGSGIVYIYDGHHPSPDVEF